MPASHPLHENSDFDGTHACDTFINCIFLLESQSVLLNQQNVLCPSCLFKQLDRENLIMFYLSKNYDFAQGPSGIAREAQQPYPDISLKKTERGKSL